MQREGRRHSLCSFGRRELWSYVQQLNQGTKRTMTCSRRPQLVLLKKSRIKSSEVWFCVSAIRKGSNSSYRVMTLNSFTETSFSDYSSIKNFIIWYSDFQNRNNSRKQGVAIKSNVNYCLHNYKLGQCCAVWAWDIAKYHKNIAQVGGTKTRINNT